MNGAKPVFSCLELGLETESIEELKKLINAEKVRITSAPKVKALMLATRWGSRRGNTYLEVMVGAKRQSTHRHGIDEYWVTYSDGDKTKREVAGEDNIYADTPENRAEMERYFKLLDQIHDLNQQTKKIEEGLQPFVKVED